MYSFSQLSVIVISIVICLIAILYRDSLSFFNSFSSSSSVFLTESEQEQFLKTLLYETRQVPQLQNPSSKRKPRLAFCCSADLDVSVRAVELMEKVFQTDEEMHTTSKLFSKKKTNNNKKKPLKKKHHERIGNLKQLQESFVFYFSNGVAAEQSMSSPEEFRQVVKFANEMNKVQHKVGGNAATMAERASVEGCDVLLGAALGKEMKKHFLNENIQVIGHIQEHEHEDIHLVLEYSKGDSFRGFESPRANRYYLNHDIHNARLSVLEEFEQALNTSFDADLVVFGGLQLMEVETDEQRRIERLKQLSKVLQNLSHKHFLTHYEFAAVSGILYF
jgi:ADP-dependent glucokinase